MCGRLVILDPRLRLIEEALGEYFGKVATSYNIPPSSRIPVVRQAGDGGFRLERMKWGLVPHWSREPSTKYSTFNARAETVDKKPAFKGPYNDRRCLIPASGFYEWRQVAGGKQPYFFTDDKGRGFALAGLWDEWKGEAETLRSCTILVDGPNRLMEKVHDRMPVILRPGDFKRWLDPETVGREVRDLLVPYPAELMRAWPVARAVGNPRNDSPSLVEPVDEPLD